MYRCQLAQSDNAGKKLGPRLPTGTALFLRLRLPRAGGACEAVCCEAERHNKRFFVHSNW